MADKDIKEVADHFGDTFEHILQLALSLRNSLEPPGPLGESNHLPGATRSEESRSSTDPPPPSAVEVVGAMKRWEHRFRASGEEASAKPKPPGPPVPPKPPAKPKPPVPPIPPRAEGDLARAAMAYMNDGDVPAAAAAAAKPRPPQLPPGVMPPPLAVPAYPLKAAPPGKPVF